MEIPSAIKPATWKRNKYSFENQTRKDTKIPAPIPGRKVARPRVAERAPAAPRAVNVAPVDFNTPGVDNFKTSQHAVN